MPVATYEQYCKMMDTAYANHYAFPAINVFDMESINGVLAGLAEAHSDGIIQMSFGGAQHASGSRRWTALSPVPACPHFSAFQSPGCGPRSALNIFPCPPDPAAGS